MESDQKRSKKSKCRQGRFLNIYFELLFTIMNMCSLVYFLFCLCTGQLLSATPSSLLPLLQTILSLLPLSFLVRQPLVELWTISLLTISQCRLPSKTLILSESVLGLSGRPSSCRVTLNGAPLRTTKALELLKSSVLCLNRFSDFSRLTFCISKSSNEEKNKIK